MNFSINKWMFVLENIYLKKRTNATQVSKDLHITYCHTVKLIISLIKYGYIKEKTRTGRIVWLELTDKGIELTDHISKAFQTLRGDNILREV